MNHTVNDRPVNFNLGNDLTFELTEQELNFTINALSPGSGTFFRILEDGDFRITESGDFIILE